MRCTLPQLIVGEKSGALPFTHWLIGNYHYYRAALSVCSSFRCLFAVAIETRLLPSGSCHATWRPMSPIGCRLWVLLEPFSSQWRSLSLLAATTIHSLRAVRLYTQPIGRRVTVPQVLCLGAQRLRAKHVPPRVSHLYDALWIPQCAAASFFPNCSVARNPTKRCDVIVEQVTFTWPLLARLIECARDSCRVRLEFDTVLHTSSKSILLLWWFSVIN